MAAVTGSLVVELGLNTAKLVTGMKKAERRISDFSKRAKAMAKTIAKIGAAAVAAAAVGIAALAKSVANAGDEFQKMSISLGVSTEALSSLKFAAELSGASMQDIEKALKTVAKRANDAQAGLSTAVRSFEQLGVSIEDSEGNLKSLDNLLIESADAFSKMTDDTKAAALAQELFGKSGVKLLPLLKQGAEGIRAMQEEAKRLGITFDREAADQAALFNDELLRLQRTLTGVKTQIGQALLPVLTELITDLKEVGIQMVTWVKANQELIRSEIVATFEAIKNALAGILSVMIPVVGFFGAVKDRIVLISRATALATEGIIRWTDFITANEEELRRLVRTGEELIGVNQGLNRIYISISKPIQKVNKDIKDLTNNLNIFGQKGVIAFNNVQEAVIDFGKTSKSFWENFLSEGSFAMNVIHTTMENQIFDFFKTGTINMKNLWKNMLDAILREISSFIASSIVKTFLSIISGNITGGGKGISAIIQTVGKALFGTAAAGAVTAAAGTAAVAGGAGIVLAGAAGVPAAIASVGTGTFVGAGAAGVAGVGGGLSLTAIAGGAALLAAPILLAWALGAFDPGVPLDVQLRKQGVPESEIPGRIIEILEALREAQIDIDRKLSGASTGITINVEGNLIADEPTADAFAERIRDKIRLIDENEFITAPA